MALPALHGLAAASLQLTIQAPPWGVELYAAVDAHVEPRIPMVGGDVAVLFPPSLRAAWHARRLPRRIGTATDWRRPLLTDVVPEGRHRRDTYAALVAALGVEVEGEPSFPCAAGEPEHVGLNPVSPSGAPVQWWGYRQLAQRLNEPVVFYGGPGEDDAVARWAGSHPRRVGLPLPAFAASLARCSVFVSNDSGSAHFARACGVPTVVVFGSTSPERTGPAGAIAVEGPTLRCRPCYRKRCPYRLECLDIPVDAVVAAVHEARRG